jgi:hypothetical protein
MFYNYKMKSQNQILRYFDLPISQEERQKYRNLSEEEKMNVETFMEDENQPNQQINRHMILNLFSLVPGTESNYMYTPS